MLQITRAPESRLWRYALWLVVLTVVYNLVEGLVSVYFGAQDETLTRFGFGLDSFIEVMSGLGILAMVLRIRPDSEAPRPRFEQRALQVTGTSFYLLAAGLAATSDYNPVSSHQPTTTLPGLIIWPTPITRWCASICRWCCWPPARSIKSPALDLWTASTRLD